MDDVTRRRIESFDRCEPWFTDNKIIQDYGAPVDWVQQCTDKADAFEAAASAQSSPRGQKVGKRAVILATVDELMRIKRTCGYIIENVFADDIEALASWRSTSHVDNPPKNKEERRRRRPDTVVRLYGND